MQLKDKITKFLFAKSLSKDCLFFLSIEVNQENSLV